LEQIYSYTATSTGNYSFNVTSVTGGGYVIGWKASSGGCSGTGWNCAGTATTPGTVGSICGEGTSSAALAHGLVRPKGNSGN
jgi:hypothetical protein